MAAAANAMTQMVNAWIFLNEDEPTGTNYNSPNSSYQMLIRNGVYNSVDLLCLCFATTVPTGPNTVPKGDGSFYTLQMGASGHPGGLTNQDYMNSIIQDARKVNPGIKIAMTLVWGDGDVIANIFSNTKVTPQQNAEAFAANLVAYLRYYKIDGFDVDWESPLSDVTTTEQFRLLFNAVGAAFKKQRDRHFYLTLSPAEVGNLDATAVNNNVDFVNLQLYSGFTTPGMFTQAGVNASLFAYGAKFESDYQTAQQAYQDNKANYQYPVFTAWRLNSDNFVFEQRQQQVLYRLVFPARAATAAPKPAAKKLPAKKQPAKRKPAKRKAAKRPAKKRAKARAKK
jgi:hypothetical protein